MRSALSPPPAHGSCIAPLLLFRPMFRYPSVRAAMAWPGLTVPAALLGFVCPSQFCSCPRYGSAVLRPPIPTCLWAPQSPRSFSPGDRLGACSRAGRPPVARRRDGLPPSTARAAFLTSARWQRPSRPIEQRRQISRSLDLSLPYCSSCPAAGEGSCLAPQPSSRPDRFVRPGQFLRRPISDGPCRAAIRRACGHHPAAPASVPNGCGRAGSESVRRTSLQGDDAPQHQDRRRPQSARAPRQARDSRALRKTGPGALAPPPATVRGRSRPPPWLLGLGAADNPSPPALFVSAPDGA